MIERLQVLMLSTRAEMPRTSSALAASRALHTIRPFAISVTSEPSRRRTALPKRNS